MSDLCVKWEGHHSTLFSDIEHLCASAALCDVTLCADNKRFSAHKVVLAVASKYFNNIFTNSHQQHNCMSHMPTQAVIYLKDVDPVHLELILQYMYRGEMTVREDALPDLLKTAKGLGIKGLTEVGHDEDATVDSAKHLAKGRKRTIHVTPTDEEEEGKGHEQAEFAGMSTIPGDRTTKRKKIGDGHEQDFLGGGDMQYQRELDPPEYHEQHFAEEEVDTMCGSLVKTEVGNDGLIDPTSSCEVFIQPPFPGARRPKNQPIADNVYETCPICGRTTNNRSHFETHMRTHTKESPYKCDICQRSFTQSNNLYRHQRTVHGMKFDTDKRNTTD